MVENKINKSIKYDIIRELRRCNPENIKSLNIIYYNSSSHVRYCYYYQYTSHVAIEVKRELTRVLLSLWKLRDYVEGISVDYFPFSDDDSECVNRWYNEINFALNVFDFIKTTKK